METTWFVCPCCCRTSKPQTEGCYLSFLGAEHEKRAFDGRKTEMAFFFSRKQGVVLKGATSLRRTELAIHDHVCRGCDDARSGGLDEADTVHDHVHDRPGFGILIISYLIQWTFLWFKHASPPHSLEEPVIWLKGTEGAPDVEVGSLQPNQPGV